MAGFEASFSVLSRLRFLDDGAGAGVGRVGTPASSRAAASISDMRRGIGVNFSNSGLTLE